MRLQVGTVIAAGLLLSACGGTGADSDNVVVTPSPTPSPTPTPTPSPTPAPTGVIEPTAESQSLAVSQMFDVDAGGSSTSDRSVTRPGGAFSIAYNRGTGSFSLTDAEHSAMFSPADFTGETNPPDYFPRVDYQTSRSGQTDYLTIFKSPTADPPIPFTHATYGAWQHNTNEFSHTRVRLDYFVYGVPTPEAAMPETGTRVYRWAGTGNWAGDSELWFVQESGTMSVDFSAGTFTTEITLTGSDFFGETHGGLIGFEATGTISGNSIEGPLDFTVATMSGTFAGRFFGPHAENVGFVFSGSDPYHSFNGAAVGTTP